MMSRQKKLQFYQSVSEEAAGNITKTVGNWTNFLDSAAKMYKYPFPDQLLIHTQRPDATACAPIEMWNDSFNRWVKRGTKGIALIDDTGNYPRLKYVFDVSDTGGSSHNSRPVHLWEMKQEHNEIVTEALANVHGEMGNTLPESFRNIAYQLACKYYSDNFREIRFCAEGSILDEHDDDNLRVAIEDALTNSIAYTLMSRCGFNTDAYFVDEDFNFINDFDTPDMVYALGTAANELSAQVLRDIESAIKKYEREQTVERSQSNEHEADIQPSRGLPVAGHQVERTAERTDSTIGAVRDNEESISERTQEDDVQLNAVERDSVPTSARNGRIGELSVGGNDKTSDGEEQSAR